MILSGSNSHHVNATKNQNYRQCWHHTHPCICGSLENSSNRKKDGQDETSSVGCALLLFQLRTFFNFLISSGNIAITQSINNEIRNTLQHCCAWALKQIVPVFPIIHDLSKLTFPVGNLLSIEHRISTQSPYLSVKVEQYLWNEYKPFEDLVNASCLYLGTRIEVVHISFHGTYFYLGRQIKLAFVPLCKQADEGMAEHIGVLVRKYESNEAKFQLGSTVRKILLQTKHFWLIQNEEIKKR